MGDEHIIHTASIYYPLFNSLTTVRSNKVVEYAMHDIMIAMLEFTYQHIAEGVDIDLNLVCNDTVEKLNLNNIETHSLKRGVLLMHREFISYISYNNLFNHTFLYKGFHLGDLVVKIT